MSDRILTYDELAEALGRSGEAVRALVIRKRWKRTIGNDGKARVYVPEEAVEALRSSSGGGERSGNEAPAKPPLQRGASEAPSEAASEAPVIALLHARIAELALELRETRAALAAASEKAAKVEGLEALLEAERKRVDEVREAERVRVEEWKAVADRFATQAERITAAVEARHSWWPWRRRA